LFFTNIHKCIFCADPITIHLDLHVIIDDVPIGLCLQRYSPFKFACNRLWMKPVADVYMAPDSLYCVLDTNVRFTFLNLPIYRMCYFHKLWYQNHLLAWTYILNYSLSSVLVVLVVGAGYVILWDDWPDFVLIWTRDVYKKTRRKCFFYYIHLKLQILYRSKKRKFSDLGHYFKEKTAKKLGQNQTTFVINPERPDWFGQNFQYISLIKNCHIDPEVVKYLKLW